MKKILLLIMILIIAVSSTGCTVELYQRMIIKGIGVDKVSNGYKVSVRYASLKEDFSEELVTAQGETIFEALNNLSLTTGKQQMYSSTSYVIYGKKAAEAGIDKAIDFFIRYFKARPTINLYIAKDTAEEILNTKNKEDKLIQSHEIKAFTENQENKGKTVSATALSFISDIRREGSGTVVPLIEKNKDEISCTKSVVFSRYIPEGVLTENETQGYLISTGKFSGGSYVLKDKTGEKLTVEITQTNAKTSMKLVNGKPEFKVLAKIDAMLASIPISNHSTGYKEIEKLVEEKVKKSVKEAMVKCQKSKTDIHGFGYMLYQDETSYWQGVRGKWNEEFSKAKITIEVKANLTRIGEEDQPPY